MGPGDIMSEHRRVYPQNYHSAYMVVNGLALFSQNNLYKNKCQNIPLKGVTKPDNVICDVRN